MKLNKEDIMQTKWFGFFQKYWLYITVILAVIIVAVSSLSIYREEVLEIDPDVKLEKQSTLSFASAYLDTLNPIVSKSEDTYYISKLIYNSLFDYDDNLNLEGELVHSYSVDTEKAYIDITLRQDATWHNGEKLTASDVSFTVNAIKSYGSKGLYYEKVSKIHTVNVKDDYNLRIYFNNNYNCSLDDLVFPVLPQSEYSGTRALLNDTDDFVPVGSGMYRYSSYDPDKRLVLKSNEEYFGEKASNTVSFEILPDKDMASSMLKIGSVTCYTDIGSERKSTVEDEELQMYDIISNNAEFIVFNTEKDLLSSKEVRQGICYAINETQVLSEGYMDDGILSDTIYYPGFMGVEDTGKTYSFDDEKAKKILAEQGLEDTDLNGRIEDSDGKDVSLTVLVNNNNASRVAAARIVEKNLERLGFDIEVSSLSWEKYNDAIEKGDFDILLTGYEMEASYDLRRFFDGKNPWGYKNNDLLEKVRQLDRLHTAEEYTAIYQEIKELLIDEVPYYSLCYKKMGLIGVNTFKADRLPAFHDIYRNCNTWYWEKKISD